MLRIIQRYPRGSASIGFWHPLHIHKNPKITVDGLVFLTVLFAYGQ